MIVGHYLEEPFFDDLRTKQQLGYVVASRSTSDRGMQSIWFLIQSPTKCGEYQIAATNKFLLEQREKVKNLTEE
jgi:secreted Zn-dependent insulinase-like peptidase